MCHTLHLDLMSFGGSVLTAFAAHSTNNQADSHSHCNNEQSKNAKQNCRVIKMCKPGFITGVIAVSLH